MEKHKYKAVTCNEMRGILGASCSPDKTRNGYVIGPDINNRLCHVASCHSLGDAVQRANKLNKEFG
jgi:hypothetical protein